MVLTSAAVPSTPSGHVSLRHGMTSLAELFSPTSTAETPLNPSALGYRIPSVRGVGVLPEVGRVAAWGVVASVHHHQARSENATRHHKGDPMGVHIYALPLKPRVTIPTSVSNPRPAVHRMTTIHQGPEQLTRRTGRRSNARLKNLHTGAFYHLLFPAASIRLSLMGKQEISEWMAQLARRKARKMTKAQRIAHARKMAKARWRKGP